jgi:hypothetical protein
MKQSADFAVKFMSNDLKKYKRLISEDYFKIPEDEELRSHLS